MPVIQRKGAGLGRLGDFKLPVCATILSESLNLSRTVEGRSGLSSLHGPEPDALEGGAFVFV